MNYKENKQVLLTLFITMIMMATTLFTFGQTTINPDTVCANALGEQYFVTNTPTSTYQWTITGGGGALQTGQGTNSVTVDWGGISGLYPNAVEIIESNALYRANWYGTIPNVKQNDFDNPKQSRSIKNHNKNHIPITLHNKNNNHNYDCYYHFSILPKNYKPKACSFCQVRTTK